MNTKFDVGQRVTYPVTVRHEAKISAILIGKDGNPRYSVGGRMVDESELAEAEVAFGRPAKPEPAVSDNPEPVKLYCVKDYRGNLTRGKIYEVKDGFMRYDDGSKAFMQWMDNAEDIKESWLYKDGYLVHLVKRPAKVGEWVYVLNHGTSRYEEKRIYKVFDTGVDSCVWFAFDLKGNILKENYLVLDGYHGEQEE